MERSLPPPTSEKICVLDKLCSGLSYSVVGHEAGVTNLQYLSDKVSGDRNTHKTRLCTDKLTKIL